jgi:hypothetical protein
VKLRLCRIDETVSRSNNSKTRELTLSLPSPFTGPCSIQNRNAFTCLKKQKPGLLSLSYCSYLCLYLWLQIDDLTLHFSSLEKQTLWIFEIYALAECLACCHLEQSIHLRALVHTTSSDHDHDHEEECAKEAKEDEEMKQEMEPSPPLSPSSTLFSVVTENNFCRKRAQVCLDRSLKVH